MGSPNIKGIRNSGDMLPQGASAQRYVTRMQGYNKTFCYCKM